MAFARPVPLNRLLRCSTNPAALRPRQQARWQSYSSNDRPHRDQPLSDISHEGERATDPSSSPAPRSGDSAMIRQEGSEGALISHQPDFHAPVDHGTSYEPAIQNYDCIQAKQLSRAFSPIPRRVMDGSEPGDLTAAAVLSGAPVDLQARTARYDSYPPTG